jgi:hypothetical protein
MRTACRSFVIVWAALSVVVSASDRPSARVPLRIVSPLRYAGQTGGYTPFSATGGAITQSGAYTIHTFTSSGTFTTNGSGNVDVLVVAGGGGGRQHDRWRWRRWWCENGQRSCRGGPGICGDRGSGRCRWSNGWWSGYERWRFNILHAHGNWRWRRLRIQRRDSGQDRWFWRRRRLERC